jgi:hypothetical protein
VLGDTMGQGAIGEDEVRQIGILASHSKSTQPRHIRKT